MAKSDSSNHSEWKMNYFDTDKLVQNRRVLVVDDQRAVHDDFQKILVEQDKSELLQATESMLFGDANGLAGSGFPMEVDLCHAYQGQEGLQKVQDAVLEGKPYGVAFVDVRMPPGIDGIQTAKQMWKIDPDLQVVICTAYSDYSFGEVIEQLDKSDQFLFLKKPFEIVEVRQIVSALLRRWELSLITRHQIRQLECEMEKSRTVIESTYGAYLVSDHVGQIVEWPPTAAKLFGWSEDQILGKSLSDTVFPIGALVAGPGLLLHQCREEGQLEITARTTDGCDFPCEITLAEFPNGDGTTGNLHFFIRDIRDRLAEESKQAQTQKLEAIGQLAAGIAHEINTPTQYVNDNVQFLQDSFGDFTHFLKEIEDFISAGAKIPELEPLVARIKEIEDELDLGFILDEIPRSISQSLDGLSRIATIVRAMKEFSHPDVDKKRAPFDVNQCIRSTTTVARNEWKYVADMELDLTSELPAALGHKGEFNQTILNLVINAAHAIEASLHTNGLEKGKISIRTTLVDGWLEVQIGDTGTGIPKEIHQKIFDPFFTTKQVGKGTGQGLSIAFNMVKKHGGSIWFETEPDVGTTFFIRLPTIDSEGKEAEHQDQFASV